MAETAPSAHDAALANVGLRAHNGSHLPGVIPARYCRTGSDGRLRMDPDRIYRHFCMTARALEVVGERWSLLIVRDLQLGPRRFTDLLRGLDEITPTRLTDRLRHLEAAGVVAREPPNRGREVWYRLTDAGRDLEPVIDSLTLWGIDHALQPPGPREAVHPEPTMTGTKVWLNRYGGTHSEGLAWLWSFPGEDYYTLRFTDGRWQLTRGREDSAALTVVATPESWGTFLTSPRDGRRLPTKDISLEGSRTALRRFAKAFGAQLAPVSR
jgi:DNA-binding HxlR family transcriptional regulator